MGPKLPPIGETPRNTAGMRFLEIEQYEVASWGPLPDGAGPQTQVHFILTIAGEPAPLVMRIKSADACDLLIAALQRHRDDVWGKPRS